MTSAQLLRASGLALLTGAIAFAIHILARSAITASADGMTATFTGHPLWVPVNALGAIGALLVLGGMPAMYARMAGSSGVLGLVGVTLLAVGWLFFGVFLSFYSTVIVPWLVDNAPQLADGLNQHPPMLAAFVGALLAEVVGMVLFAIPFLRGSVAPRWTGYVLIAAAVMTIAGIFIAPVGPAANFTVNLLSNLGPVLLTLALGTIGARMVGQHAADEPVHLEAHTYR